MLSDLPFFADIHQERRDQPEAGSFIRKKANHPGTPADLLVDALQAVGCPDGAPVLKWKIENYEPFRKVLLPTRPISVEQRQHISGWQHAEMFLPSADLER